MSKQALVKTLSALKQGGTLSIRSRVPHTNLRIIPEWREDGMLTVGDHSAQLNVKIKQEADQMTSMGRSESYLSVLVDSDDSLVSNITVTAHVPEKVNLSCHLEHGGTIQIENKVEGDVDLLTTNGNILLNKIRGYQISLQASQGTIYSSNLVEANKVTIKTTPGRVRAKRIHGTQVDIQVTYTDKNNTGSYSYDTGGISSTSHGLTDEDDEGAAIDISSLYISGNGAANLLADGFPVGKSSIRCKSHHGHINAQSTNNNSKSDDVDCPNDDRRDDDRNNDDVNSQGHGGLIELGGVNGSFDVNSSNAARIHLDSLAQDSISVASTKSWLQLSLDRKLETDLRLVSGQGVQDLARTALLEDDATIIQAALQQHESTSAGSISVITSAFTDHSNMPEMDHLTYKQGWVENKSLEPDSRFERGAGKIRFEGAAKQALDGFSASSLSAARPLMVGASEGRITVESLSWLGAIARRYGLEEEERKDDLGRQATRKGRPLVTVDQSKD